MFSRITSIARIAFRSLLLVVVAGCGPGQDIGTDARVYVAMGASDAVGVGARDPMTEGWVPRLHSTMPADTRLVNLGVSGSELSEALEEQLPVALDARPDLVTVWLAVNDLKNGVPLSRYERDLDTLLDRLQSTGATVAVGNIPDLSLLPIPDYALHGYGVGSRATLRAEIDRWNEAIERQVRAHGALLVDIHSQWRTLRDHPEYLGADGFHPSSEGYARLAEFWRERLQTAGVL